MLGEVNYKDLQTTQSYNDLLLRASHVLQSNIDVLRAAEGVARKRQLQEGGGFPDRYEAFQDIINSTVCEFTLVINHISLVCSRLDRITGAVCFQTVLTAHFKNRPV
jgi:hypothetical protein